MPRTFFGILFVLTLLRADIFLEYDTAMFFVVGRTGRELFAYTWRISLACCVFGGSVFALRTGSVVRVALESTTLSTVARGYCVIT